MPDITKHSEPPEMKCPHCGKTLPKPEHKEPPKDANGKHMAPPNGKPGGKPDGKHEPKAMTCPYCGKTIEPPAKKA